MTEKRISANVLTSICDCITQTYSSRTICAAEQGIFETELVKLLVSDSESYRKIRIHEATRNSQLNRKAVQTHSSDARQLLKRHLVDDRKSDDKINELIEAKGKPKPVSLLDDLEYQPPKKKRKLKT